MFNENNIYFPHSSKFNVVTKYEFSICYIKLFSHFLQGLNIYKFFLLSIALGISGTIWPRCKGNKSYKIKNNKKRIKTYILESNLEFEKGLLDLK
jgi:hypothetical protein